MNASLSVAVPWSLSHYLPLNGFHPLYRALLDTKPKWLELQAWDNIKLSNKLRGNRRFRREILIKVQQDTKRLEKSANSFEKEYFAHFWAPNIALTRLLPGDIEFLHTAPFPSLERPFVFHCESFAPIFFPFMHQGTGKTLYPHSTLRAFYTTIFEHPLCLGISSHLPSTLQDISRFFHSQIIDDRLFASRIGLHASDTVPTSVTKGPLNAPIFLFINSASQNPNDFFLRGGHLALRYWQAVYPCSSTGRLIMRCKRPIDELLKDSGVDLDWLKQQERHSVIWIEEYLEEAELDVLMEAAHFFLLPSRSLHSVSIMKAMAAGAVPIVSDTLGTDRYVTDTVDGIVLKGVFSSSWRLDPDLNVMIDQYQSSPELDYDLIQQLVRRVGDLQANPSRYHSVQEAAISKARQEFSGKAFSEDFWIKVLDRYKTLPKSTRMSKNSVRNRQELTQGLLEKSDWARSFTSPTQPITRLRAGHGRVDELGGCFITVTKDRMDLHDWSPIAEYVSDSAPPLIYAADIKGLDGSFMGSQTSARDSYAGGRLLVSYIAEKLMPYPNIYSNAANLLKYLRRIKQFLTRYFPSLLSTSHKANFDVQLIRQDIKGFNIIRCGSSFYAVPMKMGEFTQARFESGDYDVCPSGSTVRLVLRNLDALENTGNEL